MSQEHEAMKGGKEFKPLKFKLGKPDDILKGILIAKEWKTPDQGEPYWECEVRVQICKYHDLEPDEAGNYVAVTEVTEVPAGGTIKLYGGRKELDELISNSNLGDVIGIQFLEYVKGKGPKPFKSVLAKNFGPDASFNPDVEAAKKAFPGSEVEAQPAAEASPTEVVEAPTAAVADSPFES